MDNFEDHMEVLKKHEQNQVNVLDIERLHQKGLPIRKMGCNELTDPDGRGVYNNN